jgi:hypothetical protein
MSATMRTMKSMPDRSMACVTALALAALVAAVCFLEPGSTPFLPPCLFHLLTGFYCPGCGSTRMMYFLVHGHPYLAFRQNPLALLTLPGVLYGLGRQILAHPRSLRFRVHPGWVTAFLVVVVLFTVLRNIPYAPFCALAPGGIPAQIRAQGEVRGFAVQAVSRAEVQPPAPSL